jgi:hypothetical protein
LGLTFLEVRYGRIEGEQACDDRRLDVFVKRQLKPLWLIRYPWMARQPRH